METTLLIWDIDGTLISTRAGRRAFNRAFAACYGLMDAAATIPMAGKMDPQIYAEICRQHGLDLSDFPRWKAAYLAALGDELEADAGRVLPGVVPVLDACLAAGFGLALGTGNIEEGARLKLRPHDLNRYFPVGGFGADGSTRAEVIATAAARAARHYGRRFERVAVVGDTPLDIACAKENGFIAIAVATGHYGPAELARCGADLVLPDLSDTAGVISLLINLNEKVA